MSGVAIRNLSVAFSARGGPIQAVRDVSVEIEPGEMLGLVGESGSGKSTIAFAVMGLLADNAVVSSGEAEISGQVFDLTRRDSTAALRGRGMAMIFQDPLLSLNPVFRIRSHLLEVLRRCAPALDRKTHLEMAESALAQSGMPPPRLRLTQYPHELSGGMRQRVVIAMALLARPVLLIADEPTTALDVTVEAQVMKEVCKLRDTIGCSVLLITHSLGLVSQYCDRLAVLYAGERLEAGQVTDVQSRPGHPYTRMLMGCEVTMDTARDPVARNNLFKVIAGELPDPRLPRAGCIFRARCDVAMPECATTLPRDRLVEGRDGHLARCLRVSET